MNTLFLIAALLNNVDPALLEGICYVETKHTNVFTPRDGKSPSWGICQLKLGTAREVGYSGPGYGLLQPETNVFYASRYLRKLYRRFGSDRRAVSAYNCGRPCGNSTYVGKVLNEQKRRNNAMFLRETVRAQTICPVRLLVLSKMPNRGENISPAFWHGCAEWGTRNDVLLWGESWRAEPAPSERSQGQAGVYDLMGSHVYGL
jgi:hypothetical protein